VIPDLILGLLTGVVNTLYGLLPDWNWNPASWTENASTHPPSALYLTSEGGWTTNTSWSPFTSALVFLKSWNAFMPIDQLVLLINFLIAYGAALIAYRTGKWILGMIRGAGTT
jgi:hypothetical protein